MKRHGFTLIEMLIAIVIFVMAILMTAGALVVGQRIKEKVEKMRMVQEEGRALAEFIAREIQSAEPDGLIIKPMKNPQGGDYTYTSTLEITRIEAESNKLITEIIKPSIDNNYLELGVEKEGQWIWQNVNSERTILRKLKFTPVGVITTDPEYKVDYVNVELLLEESQPGPIAQATPNLGMFKGLLGQPSQIELHFTAVPRKK